MDTTKEKEKTAGKKFLFNLNDFDDAYVDPNEELEPPPPVFSEEELEAAKKESYTLGKQAGAEEARASREQAIAEVIEVISRDTSILFEAELGREKTYELESVKLSLAIFKKIFPHYTQAHGLNELKEAISSVLQKQSGIADITISVHPDAVSGVKEHIKAIPVANEKSAGFKVQANEDLSVGDCKLSWSDGGAVRNSDTISGEITRLMEDALAAHGVNVHDEQSNASCDTDANAKEKTKPENLDLDDNQSGEII